MKDICDMRVTFSRFSVCFDMECLENHDLGIRSVRKIDHKKDMFIFKNGI